MTAHQHSHSHHSSAVAAARKAAGGLEPARLRPKQWDGRSLYAHETSDVPVSRFADMGRQLNYLVKCNPHGSDTADQDTWRAVAADYWEELRPGKRPALWAQTVSIRDDNKVVYVVKRVMRLVERTADRDGQLLLEPAYELEGGWTSLDEAPEAVIKRYQARATHDLILHLAQLADNIQRLMGQLGMNGELSPARHPAKRRRLRTVL